MQVTVKKQCFQYIAHYNFVILSLLLISLQSFGLIKQKTLLPSLNTPIPKMPNSCAIYTIKFPVSTDSYLGQTVRHIMARFREHTKNEGPVKEHITACGASLSEDDIEVEMLCTDPNKLLTYEALFIKEIEPKINRKQEFKSRDLTIKWILDSIYSRRGVSQ